MISLTLPWPPSSNVYWRMGHGHMHRSKAATDYIEALRWKCLADGVREPLEGHLAITAVMYFPWPVKGDLGNREKVLSDACNGVVWVDDAQLWDIHLIREYSKENPRVELTVEAA